MRKSILSLILIGLCFSESWANEELLKEKSARALFWLRNQVTPNKIIPKPDETRSGMVLSYVANPNAPNYKYIFNKSLSKNMFQILIVNLCTYLSYSAASIKTFFFWKGDYPAG